MRCTDLALGAGSAIVVKRSQALPWVQLAVPTCDARNRAGVGLAERGVLRLSSQGFR